jgi:hypothetical protein
MSRPAALPAALGLGLALAACAPRAAAPPPAGSSVPPSAIMPAAQGLTPDANGLQPGGTSLRIDFGRAQAGVVAAVSRLLGTPPASTVQREGCPGGGDTYVTWATGLTLAFRAGSFVGWRDAAGRSAGDTCEGV